MRTGMPGRLDTKPVPSMSGRKHSAAEDESRMNDQPREKQSEGEGTSFDIFTVLSHDLKSPLNAVESYLDIMINKILGETIEPYMPILGKCVARLHQMRELITDISDWSRIQSPSSSRTLTAIDVSRMAHTVLNAYQEEAIARNISISTAIEDALTMKAVGREIDLILRHLIDNAIKYNKDMGSVAVTIKKAGSHIDMTVADTGIGMTAEEQARLFQEFVRIKNNKTQGINGTGLGLVIIKKLVDLYGGMISVESESGKGTTFSLTF
jgi:two-component system sensor histidine kinase/response regulator